MAKRKTKQYIVAGHVDGEDGTLYWSNDDGWGLLSTATIFAEDEKDKFNLPDDNEARWVQLPSFVGIKRDKKETL